MSFINQEPLKNVIYTEFNNNTRPWKLNTTYLYHNPLLVTDFSYLQPFSTIDANNNNMLIEAVNSNINFIVDNTKFIQFNGKTIFNNFLEVNNDISCSNLFTSSLQSFSSTISNLYIENNLNITNDISASNLYLNNNLYSKNNLFIKNNIDLSGDILILGQLFKKNNLNNSIEGYLDASYNQLKNLIDQLTSITSNNQNQIDFVTDLNMNNNSILNVNTISSTQNPIDISGDLYIINSNNKLYVEGDVSFNNNLDVSGTITANRAEITDCSFTALSVIGGVTYLMGDFQMPKQAFEMYVENNSTVTSLTANTPTRVNYGTGNTVNGFSQGFTIDTAAPNNGRITYTSARTRYSHSGITISWFANVDKVIVEFYIAKNGVRVPGSSIKMYFPRDTQVVSYQSSAINIFIDFQQNDYIELWASSNVNCDLTVESANIFGMTLPNIIP